MADNFDIFGLSWDVLFPVINTLGWALIHFLWQGAAIGALFALGRYLLKNATPHARYSLGLVCLLLLLLAPVATFVTLYQSDTAAGPIPVAAFNDTATAAASLAIDPAQWIESALPWIVLAWTLGVMVMSGRATLNWFLMQRCMRVGVRPVNEEILQRAEMLRELLGIRRVVRVMESTLVHVPTVFGLIKPVILIPTSSLVGLTPAQLELVIAHELGHVKRWDYAVNLFQVMAETLLFYHPVVGWISRQVRDEREQCCDDLVIATCGNRLEYAKALTNLETMRSGGMEPALAATDGQLLQRIERIVCAHGRERESLLGNSGIALVVALALILAGRMADPMAALEQRRTQLADSLFAQLVADSSDTTQYVSLEDASLTVMEPEVTVDIPAESRVTVARTAAAGDDAHRSLPDRPNRAPAASPPLADTNQAVTRGLTDAPELAAQDTPAVEQVPDPSAYAAAVLSELPDDLTSNLANDLASPSAPPLSSSDSDGLPGTGAQSAPPVEAEPVATDDTALEVAMMPRQEPVSRASGPVAIHRVSPEYPRRARMSEAQGWVELEFSLKSNGRVRDVKVIDSSPRRIFDRAARRAMKKWRFDPATVTGERLTQRFDFVLEGEPVEEIAPDWRGCVPSTGSRICRASNPNPIQQ